MRLTRLTEPTDWKLGWAPQLDGLRGVATTCVMTMHFLSQFDAHVRALAIGVDVFFALSGFLITTLLFSELDRKGTISIRKFYIRRAVRLFPALYALLAVFLVFAVVAGGKDRSHYLAEVAAAFFYVYNFFVAWVGVTGNALIQLWTLSVEQQFYLLWPLAFVFAFKPKRDDIDLSARLTALTGLLLATVIVFPLLRMTLPHDLGAHTATSFIFGFSIMRPDAVALGCLAAFAMRLWPPAIKPDTAGPSESKLSMAGNVALGVIVAAILLGSIDAFRPFVSPLSNLATIACAVFVFDLVRNPDKPAARVLRLKPIVWMGERSYAMYIWHLLLFFVVKGFVEGALPGRTRLVEIAAFPLSMALTILVSMASWRFVESPAMKLKKRFQV